jgi:hypothetical protein
MSPSSDPWTTPWVDASTPAPPISGIRKVSDRQVTARTPLGATAATYDAASVIVWCDRGVLHRGLGGRTGMLAVAVQRRLTARNRRALRRAAVSSPPRHPFRQRHREPLSPNPLVRGDLTARLALQIADGSYRGCASYHTDENTDTAVMLAHPSAARGTMAAGNGAAALNAAVRVPVQIVAWSSTPPLFTVTTPPGHLRESAAAGSAQPQRFSPPAFGVCR